MGTGSKAELLRLNAQLRERLEEAEQVIHGVRSGEVDTRVGASPAGKKIHTRQGADQAYRTAVEAMSEGALTLASDGTVLCCNTSFAEMVKTPLKEITTRPFTQFVAPASRQRFTKLLARSRKGKRAGEFRIKSASGADLPAHLALVPLELAGESATCVVVTDLTNVASATDARMRLAAIVESSFEAIVSTSFDDTILSWNAAAERMFGYPAAEAVGRSIAMLRPPERAHEGRLLDEAFERGEFPLQMETVRVRKNGEKIDVKISVSPIKDAADRTIGVAVLYEDITARKRAEDSLRQLSTLLLRLQDEERRRVARDLQDSLSPVLTSLIGKLYALRKRALDLDAISHRLLEESLTLAEHAASVTGGVSSVLHPPLLEAHGLAASLKWYLESHSKRSGIRVQMDLPPLLPPLPEGAALGLFRIVEDSLTRVLRHPSNGRLSVRLENGNQRLTLEISDEAPNSAPGLARMDEGAAEFAIPVMRHRMAELRGQLDIKSEGARTVITASLPLTGN